MLDGMALAKTASTPGAEDKSAPGGAPFGGEQIAAEIAELAWLNRGIIRLLIRLSSDRRFDYRPGQHLALVVEDGTRRFLSMAAPPGGRMLELHLRYRTKGRLSRWLTEKDRRGTPIAVEGPYGNFVWRSRGSAGVILLATGTGIAPLGAMLEQALTDAAPRQSIRLYWGGRATEDFYRAPLFRRWEATHDGFAFVPVLSAEGRVQDMALAAATDLRGVDVYACGAPAMIEDARTKFQARWDMAPERFYSDAFESAPVMQAPVERKPLSLLLHGRDGVRTIAVQAGETLLVALKRAGLPLLAVCGGCASCGTCKVAIAENSRTRLTPPAKVERNLLACLPDYREGERLACQIILSAAFDQLEIEFFAPEDMPPPFTSSQKEESP